MFRFMSFAGLGLLAACLSLSAPSASHAQQFRFGYGGYDYRGYGGYGGPGYGGPGYGGYSGYGHGNYGGYGYQPRVIVHPESLHWAPGRGWHSHGHIHVPHRGHYHTYPY